MKTIEAYDLTLEKIKELKAEGILTIIKPYSPKESFDLAKMYNKKENIPPEKWIRVTFSSLSDVQAIKVRDAANYLGMCGIRFDSGGAVDRAEWSRDWELDWSFTYTGNDNEQWREEGDAVEKLIDELDKDKRPNYINN